MNLTVLNKVCWTICIISIAAGTALSFAMIWGEQDIALGIELTYGLEKWIDNLQIKRIPDSGHWVQQEQADKVNQYMLDFLQQR